MPAFDQHASPARRESGNVFSESALEGTDKGSRKVPIELCGYVDSPDCNIAAMQFSLNNGATWTTYPIPGTSSVRSIHWKLLYAPPIPGRYLLKARFVNRLNEPSDFVSSLLFETV